MTARESLEAVERAGIERVRVVGEGGRAVVVLRRRQDGGDQAVIIEARGDRSRRLVLLPEEWGPIGETLRELHRQHFGPPDTRTAARETMRKLVGGGR